MILSMTGFGKAVTICNDKKITAEIKSLNSKQLDLSIRLPQSSREIELELRNMVSKSLERGKVDHYIYTETIGNTASANFNIPMLKSYKEQIETISATLGIPVPQDWYATLLRLPDAIISADANNAEINETEIEAVKNSVSEAVNALIEFRTQEGNRLNLFFKEKIDNIRQLLAEVAPYESDRIAKIKKRIHDSLSKLEGVEYDNNRFEQEMIFYIEKLDITEEKLRLSNHLDYFIDTLDNGHGQGKKLGFISQEMGREINTLGSKSNHAEMQKIVVKMKDELEQIKEQILNVM